MKYISYENTDAFYNVAMEHYLLEEYPLTEPVFFFSQYGNAVIVGKNQNTFAEVNQAYAKENGIQVARRETGGGAVYDDLGNISFSFVLPVSDPAKVNFKKFVQPMVDALNKLGVPVVTDGRNDLIINGKKVSGSAQRYANGCLLHHGTLLFDINMEVMSRVLTPAKDKFISKAAKSVKSRVGLIKSSLPEGFTILDFKNQLTKELSNGDDELKLEEHDLKRVQELRDNKFSTWNWNWGRTPKFEFNNWQRFAGGSVEIHANVSQGKITVIKIQGDFLGISDITDLEKLLQGVLFTKDAVKGVLQKTNLRNYFGDKISLEDLESLF
ncbi:lipoate--protein ligase [Oenococcus oeni]|uniref:lipoate--protein ligase n=1 Tax=Oenococcus oeni TaxID=1247 RepID=UPI0008F977B1|nr:lipoate--protein ligase [Oenococcus oeni]OIL19203.1 lipoate--protein ligase [Oenococcus oeni]OIL23329.1 lipoate--protein ligase [Oenococcus oeni]OIL41271.1 lipoate--protein ligase [Oenococcus oeni]OIL47709.1 lipoate--protein ligase [Oenococcus oeni]OIL51207.1 lipoate--protein ligase [Oenococcus oeni]